MLELKRLTFRNFLSYGDYDTTLDLEGMGTCLILGELSEGEDLELNSVSNGAGKSAVVNAILYALFGRTMHKVNPGDNVINHFTKQNCKVELEFKNGDKLIRTRNVDGHNDLLLIKDGQDVSLGTNKAQQIALNKELGLDWDLFCGSTFFSQFGRTSWMEMSDQKRKEALEREFHMDRIKLYADVAKNRTNKIESEQAKLQIEANRHQSIIDNLESEISSLQTASDNFELHKQDRLSEAQLTLQRLIESRDSIVLTDIDALTKQHNLVSNIEAKLNEQDNAISILRDKHSKIAASISHKESLINKWKNKGDYCTSCEQPIPKSHISERINDPQSEIDELTEQANALDVSIKEKTKKLAAARQLVQKKRPDQSIAAAKREHDEWARRDKNIKSQQKTIKIIDEEQNHYGESIDKLKTKIEASKKVIDGLKQKIGMLDTLISHTSYVHKAYHDRRKIKSHILQEYVPYLNERIAHYLSVFKVDLAIEFTNALSIKSNLWGYEFYSGGERKRVDLAIMLALFDLHSLMYGRQCNIMVFDEVDQHLDLRGAEIFSDLIRSDFASKVDSIFIISHRPDMKGSMSSEIKIRREDRFSKIVEVIK